MSLAKARERRNTLRRQLTDGIDPSKARKEERAALAHSFKDVAEDWFAKQVIWQARACALYKQLGQRSVGEIEAPDMLDALRLLETTSIENAKRGRQLASAVFQYAIASRRARYDPAAGLGRRSLRPGPRTDQR